MAQEWGKNWIRFDSRQPLINRYWDLLKEVDAYIQRHNDLEQATYWAVCRDNKQHNEIFCSNNQGKRITTPWIKIVKQFPELTDLQNRLNLHSYIGRTMTGNWGVHRHCYAPDSVWNLVIFDSGCSQGTMDFYRDKTTDQLPSSEYYEDERSVTEQGFALWESVNVMTGDVMSINTWTWHSHTTKSNKNVCAFLSCLKDTPPRSQTLRQIRSWSRNLV